MRQFLKVSRRASGSTASGQGRKESRSAAAWMKGPVSFQNMSCVDVGVDLRGGDVGVAEKLLNQPQVRAALEQMRGERMAQDVRANLARNPRRARVFLQALEEPDARDAAAANVDEHERGNPPLQKVRPSVVQ